MAEETPPAGQPTSTEDSGKLTAGTLRGWIKEEIKALIPGQSTKDSTPTGNTQPPVDIQGEVAKALDQLKAREDRKNRDERVDKMLEKFEAPAEEVAPKEVRKVHKFMGWGE